MRATCVGQSAVVALALLTSILASGCTQAETSVEPSPSPVAPLPSAAFTTTNGLDATLYQPPGARGATVPLVVLVPGGGWVSADPSGLARLADVLARDGANVVTVTYRTSSEGVYFPDPPRDIACGVAVAVAEVTQRGTSPSEVTVAGHSAGAQLAALVALAPDEFADPECPAPARAPDRLVGLAGPYDVTLADRQARNLFGPDLADPQDWTPGNPFARADLRGEMPVLLVHGTADAVVPVASTEQFATALEDGGHEVTVQYLDGVDHETVYSAEVVGPVIAEWLGLDGS